jgi:hypothetical protein
MDKVHKVEEISFRGTTMFLRVDGRDYEVDISSQSQRLASATLAQRQNFVVSPSGYGIHWPDLDEDLSVDGLIGVKHRPPLKRSGTADAGRTSVQASTR